MDMSESCACLSGCQVMLIPPQVVYTVGTAAAAAAASYAAMAGGGGSSSSRTPQLSLYLPPELLSLIGVFQ